MKNLITTLFYALLSLAVLMFIPLPSWAKSLEGALTLHLSLTVVGVLIIVKSLLMLERSMKRLQKAFIFISLAIAALAMYPNAALSLLVIMVAAA